MKPSDAFEPTEDLTRLSSHEVAALVRSLHVRLAELSTENTRLVELLISPKSVKMELTRAGSHVDIQHWAVRLLAASLAKTIALAPNCVELQVSHPDVGQMLVTIQRRHGKSPLELKAQAEAERDRLIDRCLYETWRRQLRTLANAEDDDTLEYVLEWRLGLDCGYANTKAEAIAGVRKILGISGPGKEVPET